MSSYYAVHNDENEAVGGGGGMMPGKECGMTSPQLSTHPVHALRTPISPALVASVGTPLDNVPTAGAGAMPANSSTAAAATSGSIAVFARLRPSSTAAAGSRNTSLGGDSVASLPFGLLTPSVKGNALRTPSRKGLRKLFATTPASAAGGSLPPATPTTAGGAVKQVFRSMRIEEVEEEQPPGVLSSNPRAAVVFASDAINSLTGEEMMGGGVHTTFDMDGAFMADSSQASVWNRIGVDHVSSVLQGINQSVFAYGRTGSGKTYTIMGPPITRRATSTWSFADLDREATGEEAAVSPLGLVPRAFHALLRLINEQRHQRHFSLSFACAEIYNRSLFDLCAGPRDAADEPGMGTPHGAAATASLDKVEVRDSRMMSSAADRLTWHPLDLSMGQEEDAMASAQALIQRANYNRAHAATAANMDSSRSHVLYMYRVASVSTDGECRDATLSIVDLAGSESLDTRAGGNAAREQETKAINSALHTLTRVVHAYANAPPGTRPSHVPYRESLLTLLLKDAIGGNCRTSIIVTLGDDEEQLVHSYKSCQFAKLARGVRNCARENKVFDPSNVIASLRAQVAQLQAAMVAREEQVRDLEADVRLTPLLDIIPAGSALPGAHGLEPDAEASMTAAVMERLEAWASNKLNADDPDAAAQQAADIVSRFALITRAFVSYIKSVGCPSSFDSPARHDASTRMTPPPRALCASTSMTPRTATLKVATPPQTQAAPVVSPPKVSAPPQTPPLPSLAGACALWCAAVDAVAEELSSCTLPLASTALVAAGAGLPSVVAAARLAAQHLLSWRAALADGSLSQPNMLALLSPYLSTHWTPVCAAMHALWDEALTAHTSSVDARADVTDASGAEGGAHTPSPHATLPLPATALVDWQLELEHDSVATMSCCADGVAPSRWMTLPEYVSAALSNALREPEHTVLLLTVRGSLQIMPHAQARALRREYALRFDATAPAWPHVLPPSAHTPDSTTPGSALPLLWHSGMDGVPPFALSYLDPRAGVQTCIGTGATRRMRRVIHSVLEADLMKRRAMRHDFVLRTFRLTPTGIVQLLDDGARASALSALARREGGKSQRQRGKAAAAAETAVNAPDESVAAHVRFCASTCKRVKVDFAAHAVRADIATAPASEGRVIILSMTPRDAPPSATPSTMTLRAFSRADAAEWVRYINALAAGAFDADAVVVAPPSSRSGTSAGALRIAPRAELMRASTTARTAAAAASTCGSVPTAPCATLSADGVDRSATFPLPALLFAVASMHADASRAAAARAGAQGGAAAAAIAAATADRMLTMQPLHECCAEIFGMPLPAVMSTLPLTSPTLCQVVQSADLPPHLTQLIASLPSLHATAHLARLMALRTFSASHKQAVRLWNAASMRMYSAAVVTARGRPQSGLVVSSHVYHVASSWHHVRRLLESPHAAYHADEDMDVYASAEDALQAHVLRLARARAGIGGIRLDDAGERFVMISFAATRSVPVEAEEAFVGLMNMTADTSVLSSPSFVSPLRTLLPGRGALASPRMSVTPSTNGSTPVARSFLFSPPCASVAEEGAAEDDATDAMGLIASPMSSHAGTHSSVSSAAQLRAAEALAAAAEAEAEAAEIEAAAAQVALAEAAADAAEREAAAAVAQSRAEQGDAAPHAAPGVTMPTMDELYADMHAADAEAEAEAAVVERSAEVELQSPAAAEAAIVAPLDRADTDAAVATVPRPQGSAAPVPPSPAASTAVVGVANPTPATAHAAAGSGTQVVPATLVMAGSRASKYATVPIGSSATGNAQLHAHLPQPERAASAAVQLCLSPARMPPAVEFMSPSLSLEVLAKMPLPTPMRPSAFIALYPAYALLCGVE